MDDSNINEFDHVDIHENIRSDYDKPQGPAESSSRDAFFFAAGAALASTIIEDEVEAEQTQREVSPDGLENDESELVPLYERFQTKANSRSRPIVRWLQDVKEGKKKITDPLSFTAEEMMQMLEREGLDE